MIMASMTVQGIQALKAGAKYVKYPVSKGLFIGVTTDGDKVWVVRYSVKGNQRDYRLPKPFGLKTDSGHLSLVDARAKTAEIQALARQGIDYQEKLARDAKESAEIAARQEADKLTVKDLFDAWVETTKRKDGGAELARSFNKDVLPSIGGIVLKELQESHVRALLKPVVAQGKNRKAVVILNNLKQMFKWAGGRRPWKLLVDDPTASLKPGDVTAQGYEETERDRTLSEDEIKELVLKLPNAGLQKHIEIAIWLVLACCTRIGETIKAKWADVDLDNGVWAIPRENTKSGKAHTVYLSPFAVKQFERLKGLAGEGEWCFPNRDNTSHLCTKSPTKQIGDRQLSAMKRKPLRNRSKAADALVLSGGAWTLHDLRRTGATMLQALNVGQHLIERILNHAEPNRMVRIYQRHDYGEELKAAWKLLGDRLDLITRDEPNVIIGKFVQTGTASH